MLSYQTQKRILDIVGSIFGIIIFSPIMLATAFYIKFVSPGGPVFADMKKRIGLNKKEFRMYKFRTMIPNAQDWFKDHPDVYKIYAENNYKLDPDPRLIKGGNLLRKSSIDELPQFFNILKGDMSLVGARAYFGFELEEQAQRFPQTVDDINTTLTVKPGLTGPWQVGGRSNTPFVERIKLDAGYAKNKSILYDIYIILKTPYAVLARKGAV